MDTNVTTPQAVATVIAVEGQAFARDPSGQMRPLKAGDVLLEGDTIVTLAGGQVQLAFLDGHMLSLLPNETFTFSAETAPTTRPGIDEASLPAGEADRIIQALERGENIDDQIEAPGAGLAGGGNNLGNNFVRLLRIVEPLTPLEFQFGNIANRFEFPEIERGANPLSADNVPGVPTVTVPDENGAAAAGDKTVVESDGPIPGSFTVTAPAGLASISVGGTAVTEAQLANLGSTPVSINTGEGTLLLTGFNPATGVVSYTYDPNPQNNPGDVTDVVPVTVTDDNGIVSSINNLDIVIQDTAPLANADAASITEDAAPNTVSGNVRTNDTDNVDSPITITAGTGTSAGTYGSLALNADGSYTYTLNNAHPAVNALNNGDTLTEVFSYSVTDADGDVSTASLTVTINGSTDGVPTVTVPDENGAAAAGDKTVVESDGPIPGSFTVTAPAGLASISVGGTAVTEAQLANLGSTPVSINTGEGTLLLTGFNPATGVVSYTYDPNPQNNPGDVTDVVPVTVTDDNGIVSSINNLDIVIQDTAPLANADAASITEDAAPNTVSGNVRTNDTDNVDSPITITAGTGTSAGTYGSLALNADGSYTYTLNNAHPAVNALNNGDTLTEVFSYSVTDADGDVSTASLTVTINGSTDGVPTVTVPDENGAAAAGDKTVVESDGPIPGSFTVTAPAGLASISVGGTAVTEAQLANLGSTPVSINTGEGTLLLTGFNPATGVVSYTYDPNPQNNPGDVTDVVPVTVTDDNGIVSSINNLDIVIQDTAPLANADAASITEDAAPNTVSGNVRTNDTDNVDSPITITAGTGTSAGTYGSLALNADGSYTYTLNNAHPAVNALNNGDTLTEVFSYSVTDADGDVSTASLTVTINGSTDGVPTVTVPDENGAAAAGDKTVVESDGPIPGSFTVTAPAGLASISVGGTAVTEAQLANLGSTPVSINTGEGTLLLTGFNPATGVVSYTYDPNPQNNPDDVTDVVPVTVTDDNGIVSSINNLDIVIQDTAPLANADAASITEDAAPNTVSGNVRTNDTDNVDSPITITAGTGTSAGTYGSLALNADGSYTYTLNNAHPAVNALNNGDTLTEVFSYSVTDADGDVSTASLTVTINGSTDGVPTVTVPDENGAAAAGDKTVVESDGPIPGSFTVTAPAGLASISVGGTAVTEAQLANLGSTPVSINTGEGTLLLTGFNPATGVVSYTYDPNPQNNPGDVTDVVPVTVTDDNGIVSSINNLDIVIQDTAPLANADAASITEDAAPNTVSGNVRTNDTDNVDSPITITAGTGTSAGTYGSLALNADGSYTYTLNNAHPAVNALNNGDTLTEVFSYSVTDADGDVSTASLTVTINGSTDGVPTVTVPDENGAAAAGDKTVVESDGPIPGSFTVTAPAGLASISVGGTAVTEAQLANLGSTPVSINTGEGTLLLTGFNPATGVVSYTYDPNPQNNPDDVTDVVPVTVTDDNGIVSSINNLDIVIQDTAPLANADAASITEDAAPNTVSGNVRTNDTDNVDSPITITAGTGTSAGTYGSLALNADGSYTYTLNNAHPAVNALNNGDTLTEVFSYSVTDADGDVSTASLTVTINGSTDGVPTVTVPDENGAAAAGDKTVVESDGPIPGSFTVTAPAGLASISVGGTAVTEAQLANLGSTPVSINTGEGTLLLTGFNPATGVVSYTYDPNPQNNPGDVTDVVPVTVTDDNGIVSSINNLDIVIQDTAPLANADAASITEDAAPNTVSGNVRTNDTDNVDSPITITAGTGTSAGTYGSLALNADGSYTYTLNNAHPAVNALNNGDTLTEVFSYSVTDADGDVSTASLTVTINGSTDGVPTVTVPDENGAAAAGDKTVVESDGPIPGSFTVTAPAGLASISVGGTAVTEAQLANLGSTPVSINTGEGTLLLTGFNPATGVVSYTYDPNPQNNPDDVTDVVPVTVTDDNGIVSSINNLDIVIQDTAPLANADAASITEDAAPNTVSGNVRTNDTDNVDSPITITAGTGTSAGTYGSLALNADGSYTYTLNNAHPAVNALNNGDTLTEVFSYSVTDADGDVSTASLTVTINGSTDGVPTVTVPDENGAAAAGDKTVVESDGPIPGSFTVTAPAGLASISVGGTAVTEAQLANLGSTPVSINTGEGTLLLTGFNPATGVVSYTYDPNPQNNPGDVTDVVPVTVTDDNGIVSSINNLDIVIQDTAPLANADAASITEDAAPNTVSGNVRTNDTDNVDSPITITAGTGTSAGTYGSLALNADGSYTYTLNNAHPAVNALNNGDTLTEVFSYSVTDADGDVSTASLTVTINGSTDGVPTVTVPDENGAAAAGDKTVVESDGPIPGSFTVTAPAGLASISVGGTAVTEAQLANLGSTPVSINTGEGTLLLTGFNPATGVVSYTYDPNPQNNPGDVTDVVPVTVTDDNGIVSSINNLDIVIQDTAPLANADAASITEDAAPNTVSGNVRTNDVNNVDTPITITAGTGTTAGTYGSLLLNADGSYTYTLDNANPAVNALNTGDIRTDVFSYSVTDADGDVSTASLTVTINGTNDGPVIDLDANNSSGATGANYTTTFTENGVAVSIADADVSVTDVDSTNLTGATITLTNAQAGDVLAAGALPPGITASIVGNVVTLSGSATLTSYQTAIRAITFANTSEDPSAVARILTVSVTDGANSSNTGTTTITVVATNDPPVAQNVTASGNEDPAAPIPVTLTGSDVDGTVASFSLANLPPNGVLYLDAAMTQPVAVGSVLASGGNTLTLYYQPPLNWNGSTDFDYTAIDNLGAVSSPATATVTIAAVNDGAPLAGNDSFITTLGTPIVITRGQLLANDSLPDNAQITSVSAVSGGTLVDNGDGTWTYTPASIGSANFTYTLTDEDGQTSTATVTLATVSANDDLATVHESALANGTGAGTTVATGNLFANDGGGTGIANVNGITDAGDGTSDGFITINTSLGRLVVDSAGAGAGNYTYTLLDNADNSAPANDLSVAENFTYLSNVGTSATLRVNVVDDKPLAFDKVLEVSENPLPNYNLVLVLDVSGSMTSSTAGGEVRQINADGSTTITTRLDMAKAALAELVEEYFNQAQNVSVTLVSFSSDATILNGGVAYTDKDAAIAGINSMNGTGGTNYEAALNAVQTAFGAIDPSVRNAVYFLSDGEPSVGNIADPVGASGYDVFLANNDIQSYGVGVGTGIANPQHLNNIHNVDADGSGVKDPAIIVPDLNELDSALLSTVPAAFGGNLVSGNNAGNVLGADDGFVQTIVIDLDSDGNGTPDQTVTFTYNPASGGQIDNDSSFLQPTLAGDLLTLDSASGFGLGTLTFNFSTGDYTYFSSVNANVGDSFSLDFVARDNDGDVTAPSTVTFQVTDGKPVARPDSDTLLPNETHLEGNVITGIGTDGGLALGGQVTSFAPAGSGVDNAIDQAQVSSVAFRGVVYDLTVDSAGSAGGGTYTVSGGELAWQAASGGESLVFNQTGYYDYTPPAADIPVTPTSAAVTTTFNSAADATANGVVLSGLSRTGAAQTLTYSDAFGTTNDGVGVNGGPNNFGVNENLTVDNLERLVVSFNQTTHPYGVQDVSFVIASAASNLGSASGTVRALTYTVFDVAGNQIGQFYSNVEGTIAIPAELGNIGRIEIEANSAAYARVTSVTFESVQLNTTATAAAPVELEYVLTDADGDSSDPATLTLNVMANNLFGDTGANTLVGTIRNDRIVGGAGNDTLNGGDGHDILEGGDGNDTLNGGNGIDVLRGGAGNDTLDGGAGDDILAGGAGNDLLIGGLGSDVFRWELADRGIAGSPAADTVQDFDNSASGDQLDLRDLLQGESDDALNLTNFLHFTQSGSDAVIQVSSSGGFAGGFNAGAVDQTITLQGQWADLTSSGALGSDQQIIQDLLTKGKLITD